MELSESVQRGLQSLADQSVFDHGSFQVLVDVSFRSLLSSHGDPTVLDQPEFNQIDQILLKQSHTAAVTFILEAVKQNADQSTISIGRGLPHITDASWRLEYHMKNGQVDKVNDSFYLISLNTENEGSSEDINFTCTVEQLQDLVGKLKDAAKTMEKASQM
ncbi:COMM domain-containing protein 3 isoform X2 [Maylandia zebra]|uniref:COMM domain-containing protein 3 isoform X2 n=1 Tax=Maylandia zebra TaxID=106582 RepID=UPI0006457E8E|nr:COMM domain-containing protein 3 isoform X2 [Maylandia zebra]XP_026035907.1 COMM domain-containing protein 3 isoform X2 [Astatotilapia calliptera]XP_039900125.1 COMM domain-containing protein 3 isoform X2 [Simochromis diagramma]